MAKYWKKQSSNLVTLMLANVFLGSDLLSVVVGSWQSAKQFYNKVNYLVVCAKIRTHSLSPLITTSLERTLLRYCFVSVIFENATWNTSSTPALRRELTSVTRLGFSGNVFMANFHTKLHIFCGYFENIPYIVKTLWAKFVKMD